METKFKGGAKAKLPDYQLSGKRDIEDALAFTRPPTGELGENYVVMFQIMCEGMDICSYLLYCTVRRDFMAKSARHFNEYVYTVF